MWSNKLLLTGKENLNIINKHVHIKDIKMQYTLPLYNLEETENIPDQ